MTEQEQDKSDIEKLVPQTESVTLNGHKIVIRPLENEQQLKAAMESEKRGKDNTDFFLELVAMTLNENEGFDGVTGEDVKNSRGNILPLIMKVQEVNGLNDFLDEEELQELQ